VDVIVLFWHHSCMQNANPICDKLYPHATSAMDNSSAEHLEMAVTTLGRTHHLHGSALWLQLQHHIVRGHRPMTDNRAQLQRNQPGGVAHKVDVTQAHYVPVHLLRCN
jgi:hypothetical protein